MGGDNLGVPSSRDRISVVLLFSAKDVERLGEATLMTRRSFLWTGPMLAVCTATSQSQDVYTKQGTGITVKGKAVVCDGEAVKCPFGHDTCREIDAPVAIGNDSYQNPEVGQLRSYRLLFCEWPGCGVLFARKV